jgi:5-methylcytosine-specific restriction endonuclease McrA
MSEPAPLKRKPMQKTLKVTIFRRDNWLCRHCQRPVIFAPTFRLLELEAQGQTSEPVAYHHSHWTRHDSPLLDELGAVIDHIHPHSLGGQETLDNLCTSCNKCNGNKNAAVVEIWDQRVGRKQIKGAYGHPVHWDGMTLIFIALAKKYSEQLSSDERAWLRALVKK